MRIQRIDICGFKSFNQRAGITFDQGVTGIVGPNGSGKSNVVDAIRWVMGEQSAKHLRGRRPWRDVIFNGSESQGPSGMAEVALTLRNDRPAELPPSYREFGEITVSRRLFRDGRSEYLINKAACRLLDVMELFLGTGVGTRAYSIIEQGKVGLIVNSKPEERRALLEEAAGITKYKARKRVAERKLDYTTQNLLRIGDIVGELKRQLSTLDRQARKAERYRILKSEAREIELHEAAVEWLAARAQLASLAESLATCAARITARSDEVSVIEAQRSEARGRVSAGEEELEAWRVRAHTLELETQGQAQAEAFAREQQLELAHRVEQLGVERQATEMQREELARERASLLDLQAEIEEQLGGDGAAQAEVEQQLADQGVEEGALSEDLRIERERSAQAETETAALRERASADERRRAELVVRAERVRGEVEVVEIQRADLSHKLGLSTGQSEEFRQQRLQLTEKREDLERSAALAREQFEVNERLRRQLRDELSWIGGPRLRSLEELHRNLEGHARGVRAILRGRDGQPSMEGVRGLLADSFQAPQEIEGALEAFLEHRLQAIVVDDSQTALHGTRLLSGSEGGRATFLPLTASPAPDSNGPAHPDCLGRGFDLVRVIPGAEAVVSLALSQVWVMRTLEAALAARQDGSRCDMVTLKGEILWGSGAITGGVLEGIGVGALSQRREIDELNHGIADLQAGLEVSQKQHAELSQRIAAEGAALEALNLDAHAREVALVHAQQDVRRMTEQLDTLGAKGQALTVEQFGIQNSLDALLEARRNTELDLQARGSLARESAVRVEEQSATLRTVSLQRAQTRDRLTELKVKAAAGQQRNEATRQRVDRNQALSEELRERLGGLEEEAGVKTARVEELKTQMAAIALKLADLSRRRDDAAESLAVSMRAQAERTAEVDGFEEKSKALRQELDLARTELAKLQLREQEVTLSIGHLATSARDRHDVELESEIARFHLVPVPGAPERERLAELRESIARMGEVNLTAISEHEELASRYEKLTEQQGDLQRSVVQLKEAIVRINRTSRERFRETFELVNAQFAEVFPRLFRGGKAGLVLTEEDGEILEAGVEIFAQPPGKRLQSVNLLSGGEKALTAVALIFAIFLIKPTPFCLLDEVDAPLDDANVGRYNEMIREMSQQDFAVHPHYA